MAAMPGMDMSSMPMTGGAILLCPVVLVLSIAAAALTLNALAVLLFDRGRIALARYAARQPLEGRAAAFWYSEPERSGQ